VNFDYNEGQFALVVESQLAVHFNMEGDLIATGCEEAAEQDKFLAILANKELMVKSSSGTSPEEDTGDYPAVALSNDVVLKNQFNFSERATQSFNNPNRAKEVCTEPPPTSDYTGAITQSDVFDTYLTDIQRKIHEASLSEKKPMSLSKKKTNGDEEDAEVVHIAPTVPAGEEEVSPALVKAMKMMERIVHTNSERECFQDYKYYEDKSEPKREDGRGSFLPLWRFAYEQAHRKTVTAISWNPQFVDLFAVGYGSYDFEKQGPGLICCYTLKNTSFPEYTFQTDSGVMCLDFHPKQSSLLCVGLYDGTVSVYDIRKPGNDPIYTVKDPKIKHMDPVWQVYWAKAEPEEGEKDEEGLNFFSVASDGRIIKWSLSKTDLLNEEIVQIQLDPVESDGADGETQTDDKFGLAGGSCFDFDKDKEHLFVVGTEEGSIHSYSKAYNPQQLRSFDGHNMAVYACKWNTFHPDVFLSCSADWTVKLWERNTNKPVMTFDLNMAVGDVAWAPYSSTVFACITTDGKVRVYDLKVNKHEPIGESKVHKKAKLTHLAFNPTEPVICVGDDRGVVTVLKLSSNLRKMSARARLDISVEDEIEKLNK
jgi:dynein intermediate chain 1